MKTAIALSVVAAMAMTSGAHAGGFFAKRTNNVLSNITGIVTSVTDVVDVGNVNVLNGNTVAVGNNSSILSGIGILSGNNTANGQEERLVKHPARRLTSCPCQM
jgi:phage tail sheath protein FI